MQNSSHLIKAFDVTYTADSSTEVICPVCPVRSLTDESHHVHLTTVKVTMLRCEPLLQVRWESPCLRPFTKYSPGSKGPASVGFWSPICLYQPLGERSHHPPPVTNPCRKLSLPGRHRSHQQNRRADFLATNSWATVFEVASVWPNKAWLNTVDCMNQVITVRWEGARKTSDLLWTFIPRLKKNAWMDEDFSVCSQFSWKLDTPKRWPNLGCISAGICLAFMGQVFSSRLNRNKLWCLDISHSHFQEAQD